jgi:hypothetical protein
MNTKMNTKIYTDLGCWSIKPYVQCGWVYALLILVSSIEEFVMGEITNSGVVQEVSILLVVRVFLWVSERPCANCRKEGIEVSWKHTTMYVHVVRWLCPQLYWNQRWTSNSFLFSNTHTTRWSKIFFIVAPWKIFFPNGCPIFKICKNMIMSPFHWAIRS